MSDWLDEVPGIDEVAAEDEVVADDSPLRDLINAVADAQDRQQKVLLIAEFMEDEAAVAAVAAALPASAPLIAGLLARLGATRGLGGLSDKLGRLLRRTSKEQQNRARTRRREAAEQASSAPPGDLGATLQRDDLPPALRCPPGWDLGPQHLLRHIPDADGGHRTVEVATRPIVITARLRDAGAQSISLRLEWPTGQGWRHLIVRRGIAMDVRAVLSLSDFDAPVHSGNARDIVEFLAEFEAFNRDAIPQAWVSSVMGWQGPEGDRFLWGRQLLRPTTPRTKVSATDAEPADLSRDDISLQCDEGAAELAAALRAGGTFVGWLDAAEAARPYPSVWTTLYAALVPPLMRFLPTLQNFIVDLAGETSSGKTTALRFAASAWGFPDERRGGFVRGWNSTKAWRERAAAALGSLPLFLDDTKRVDRKEEISRTVYEFASGAGRGRGTIGGIRDTGQYDSVLLSTGEAPCTSFTKDGGTLARALSSWGSPFGGSSRAIAMAVARINAGVLEHFGHLGPMMVQWLMDEPTAHRWVRAQYAAAQARWTEKADGNPVATRAAEYVAALDVAGQIVHEVLGVPAPNGSPLAAVWSAVCEGAKQADRASEALRDVLAWAVRHQDRFYGHDEARGHREGGPPAGWLGAWQRGDGWAELAILHTELGSYLSDQGYDAMAIRKSWADRGWLRRDGNHRTCWVTVGGRQQRCVAIQRAACEQVGDAEDA